MFQLPQTNSTGEGPLHVNPCLKLQKLQLVSSIRKLWILIWNIICVKNCEEAIGSWLHSNITCNRDNPSISINSEIEISKATLGRCWLKILKQSHFVTYIAYIWLSNYEILWNQIYIDKLWQIVTFLFSFLIIFVQ